MKIFTQSLVIIFSSLTAFIIINTLLFPFTPAFIAFIGVIAVFYALIRKRKKAKEIFSGSNIEIYAIITLVLLIILYTGGVSSLLFFLTYFVLFGITFIFEPSMIILFLICLSGLFLPNVLKDDIFGNVLKFSSLLFLSPIAFFFSIQYRKREKLQASVKEKTNEIIKDANELLETKDKNEKLKKTEEIIIEAKALKKETDDN